MASESNIEWTDATFNAWIGCTKISPACDHCYAAVSTPTRALGVEWGAGNPRRRTSEANWKLPLRWNAGKFYQCMPCGWRGDKPRHPDDGGLWTCPRCGSDAVINARRRVFCSSLADVFDNEVDPQWRTDLFALIAATPNLDWLLLTKRIGNVKSMVPWGWLEKPSSGIGGWPANVWLGATICNQAEADRDIPKLLAVPARVRFLSMEPLLGRVDLCEHLGMWWNQTMQCFESSSARFNPRGLGWVIVGGESGPSARPMLPEWASSLRSQCAAAGVPFLFKQWGEWGPMQQPLDTGAPLEAYGINGEWPMLPDPADRHGGLIRCGKKNAGRTLDGSLHDGYPVQLHG